MKKILCLLCLGAFLLFMGLPHVYAASTDSDTTPQVTATDDQAEMASDIEAVEEDQTEETLQAKVPADMEEKAAASEETAQE